MSANEHIEQMVLVVLDREGALSSDGTLAILQGRMLTEAVSHTEALDTMERLRVHGYIASAGETDVRGGRLASPQWLVTARGRDRLLSLLVPSFARGFVEWLAPVPLASAVMRAFIALSGAMQRKALSRPAAGPPEIPGA